MDQSDNRRKRKTLKYPGGKMKLRVSERAMSAGEAAFGRSRYFELGKAGRKNACDGSKIKHDAATAPTVAPEVTSMRPEENTPLAKQEARDRFKACFEELARLVGGDYSGAMTWFCTPHPEIENLAPIQLIAVGEFAPVEWLVYDRLGRGAPA